MQSLALGKLLTKSAYVTEQYNLVLAKRLWRYAGGKVTAGRAESNDSLP